MAQASRESERLSIGDLFLDVGRRQVSRNGQLIELPILSFRLLYELAKAAPNVLTQDELIERVWPGQVISPQTITQRVKLLRQAIGDDANRPRYIGLVRREGYRLLVSVAPIMEVVEPAPESSRSQFARGANDFGRAASKKSQASRNLKFIVIGLMGFVVTYFVVDSWFRADEDSATAPMITDKSVAVLPFLNMSVDPEQEYFADGIAEEIRNGLAGMRELQVPGRISSISFKGRNEDLRTIGEKLSVSYVLDGSVRKSGQRVRINAQLIKADDGYQVWSETYERNLTDIFAIQDEIAQSVADALSITLGVGEGDLGRGGTQSIEAFEAYSAALVWEEILSGGSGRLYAIEHLEEAVALDPNYAKAWSLLVYHYHYTANGSNDLAIRLEFTQKAKQAAQRLVEITPRSVPSLFAASFVHWRNLEWQAAEQSLLNALELAPQDFLINRYYAEFLMNVGRPVDALTHLRQNHVTDPLNEQVKLWIVWAQILAGDLDTALQGSYELRTTSAPFYSAKIAIGLARGDLALVSSAVQSGLDRNVLGPNTAAGVIHSAMLPLLDSPETAKQVLNRISTEIPASVHFVPWAAYLGDLDLVLKTRSEIFRITAGVWRSWEPVLSDMRQKPEFKDYIKETGLLDYWRSTGNWGDFCRPKGSDDFECN